MIRRKIIIGAIAQNDFRRLRRWIANAASPAAADAYVRRIRNFVLRLDLASERGTARDDISDGLRIVGFEKRVIMALRMEFGVVVIMRVFYGGQDWERQLRNGLTEGDEAED